jgi:hypothetical protein
VDSSHVIFYSLSYAAPSCAAGYWSPVLHAQECRVHHSVRHAVSSAEGSGWLTDWKVHVLTLSRTTIHNA